MAEVEEVENTKNTEEALKPFYKRASEAEDRLAKLEAALAKKDDTDTGSKEISTIIKEFESKLEIAQAELISEGEKASKEIQKLTAENMKLQYRISHLIRAIHQADSKLVWLDGKKTTDDDRKELVSCSYEVERSCSNQNCS